MSDDDEEAPEYQVEQVLKAAVKSKKKDKINWRYLVKWKGYEDEDNTWEPPDSFDTEGGKDLLDAFWRRVNLEGRDIDDASLFKVGEELTPMRVGPPRGRPKAKPSTPAQVSTAASVPELAAPSASASRKRKRQESTSPEFRPDTSPEVEVVERLSTRSRRGRASSPASEPESPANRTRSRVAQTRPVSSPLSARRTTRTRKPSAKAAAEDSDDESAAPKPQSSVSDTSSDDRPVLSKLRRRRTTPVVSDDEGPSTRSRSTRRPGSGTIVIVKSGSSPSTRPARAAKRRKVQAQSRAPSSRRKPQSISEDEGDDDVEEAEPEAAEEAEEDVEEFDDEEPRAKGKGRQAAATKVARQKKPEATASRTKYTNAATQTDGCTCDKCLADPASSQGGQLIASSLPAGTPVKVGPPTRAPRTRPLVSESSVASSVGKRKIKVTEKAQALASAKKAAPIRKALSASPSKRSIGGLRGDEDEDEDVVAGTDGEDQSDKSIGAPAPNDADGDPAQSVPALASAGASSSALPSHRLREANPLVKMVDDPNIDPKSAQAISTKARLALQGNTGAAASGAAANGSGAHGGTTSDVTIPRSHVSASAPKHQDSLLVWSKKDKALVTQKRPAKGAPNAPVDGDGDTRMLFGDFDDGESDNMMLDGPIPGLDYDDDGAGKGKEKETAPTAEELLELAGLDKEQAESLPDFDEADQQVAEPALANANEGHPAAQGNGQAPGPDTSASASVQPSATITPVSTTAPVVRPPVTSTFSSSYKSSLFGSVSAPSVTFLASSAQPSGSALQALPRTQYTLSLSLSPEIAVPIVLQDLDHGPSSTPTPLAEVATSNRGGPPGKFYKEPLLSEVLATFRASGESARAAFNNDYGTTAQGKGWIRFLQRLQGGEVFVAIVGSSTLAFCSSENTAVGQRLGVKQSLLALKGAVVVARTVIEDHSLFAAVVLRADIYQ